MMNFGTKGAPETSEVAEKAISFITKGWREMKDSTDADIKLMKTRAKSCINIAASAFAVPSSDADFVKRLQPRLTEIQRVYSTPDFSRKVSKIWSNKVGFGINLPVPPIKTAMVSEVDGDEVVEFDERERRRWREKKVKHEVDEDDEESRWEWMGGQFPSLEKKLKEFKRKGSSNDLGEFAEKVKSSLKTLWMEPQESKEVPPLDAGELLACMVKNTGNFIGHLGFKEDFSQKILETYCSRYRSQLVQRSLSSEETSVLESQNVTDELDLRIASVIQSTGHCYDGGLWTEPVKHDPVKRKRHFAIVTTASLPWMTGTAVNPLFRAAYLAKSAKQNVTLLVPWLCKSDQELVYPNNLTFMSPEEQETYIRNWLEERVGFKAEFKISFYPGKFSKERRSILPAGDTSQFISSKDADIAILEEPEHLNWYHHGKRWTDKFNHVVGVVHTNYLEYIKREKNGALQAFLVKHINNWVTRAYCNKVLRLSAATQDLPKSVICNVHGVNPKFLQVGERVAEEKERGQQAFSKGAYFLGKMVWAKGYRELIDLLAKHKNDLEGFKLDVYGNGEDAHEVQSSAKKLDLSLNFLKGRDHGDDSLHGYKVFINPSVSDVLCTATAEALAMGKFVVCADHPSNEFFRSFPNCLTYKTSEDFVARVREALDNEPHPLTPEQRYNLSWEAATQRFIDYSDLERFLSSADDKAQFNKTNGLMRKSMSLPNMSEMVDGGLAFAHYCLTGNEILRLSTGAIPGTRDPNKQHCEDLHLLPPHVENPIYGW